jgi:hypothetical protein
LVDVEKSVGTIKSYVKPDLRPEAKDMAFFDRPKNTLHASATCRVFNLTSSVKNRLLDHPRMIKPNPNNNIERESYAKRTQHCQAYIRIRNTTLNRNWRSYV